MLGWDQSIPVLISEDTSVLLFIFLSESLPVPSLLSQSKECLSFGSVCFE